MEVQELRSTHQSEGHLERMAEVRRQIEELKIHTIEMAFSDTQGHLRGKRVPVKMFLASAHEGYATCNVPFGWGYPVVPLEGTRYTNWDTGYPDMEVRPVLETFVPLPYRPGAAFVMCDCFDKSGEPMPYAPRTILRGVVDRVHQLGFEASIGAELEFYLTTPDGVPAYGGQQYLSIYKASEVEPVLTAIQQSLEQMGIEVEAWEAEYGPAQIELNLRYGPALAMADRTILFKHVVREVARQHGLRATFMAKPFAEQSGSGFHCHQSLWSQDGESNLFGAAPGEMTNLMRWYMGGLLRYMPEIMALSNSTINAYKRTGLYTLAPGNVTWGIDNRTTALRAIVEGGSADRIENRLGSACCNPYLAMAADLAAGLTGIQNQIEPPPMVVGDGYHPSLGAAPLPTTLEEALKLMGGSQLVKEWFGDDVHYLWMTVFSHEVEAWNRAVTDWERERYQEFA